jgi:hypothetical protein
MSNTEIIISVIFILYIIVLLIFIYNRFVNKTPSIAPVLYSAAPKISKDVEKIIGRTPSFG